MYLSSDKIKVFPSARRSDSVNDPFSRLMSESTIASIINKLIDTEGFVITNTYTPNGQLEFNIHGYYFNITNSTEIMTTYSGAADDTVLFASIILSVFSSPNDSNLKFEELKNYDNGSVYEGLIVNTTVPTPATGEKVFKLAILKKVNGSWVIPQESQIKFYTNGGTI